MNFEERPLFIQLLAIKRKEQGRASRRRHSVLRLKGLRWIYPWATERAYAKWIKDYALGPLIRRTHKILEENYDKWLALSRQDSLEAETGFDASKFSSQEEAMKALMEYQNSLEGRPSFTANILSYGTGVDKFSSKQFNRFAQKALGQKLIYDKSWYGGVVSSWGQNNQKLITDLSKEQISRVNKTVREGIKKGTLYTDLMKQIRTIDKNIDGPRARLIARDQVGKLNGRLTKGRMVDAGISMYIWETSNDERVRGYEAGNFPDAVPSHWAMEGKLCRWDDDSVWSEDGGKTWEARGYDAPRAHPGEEIQCRCSALPYLADIISDIDEELEEEEDTITGQESDVLDVTQLGSEWSDSFKDPSSEWALDWKDWQANGWEENRGNTFELMPKENARVNKTFAGIIGDASEDRLWYGKGDWILEGRATQADLAKEYIPLKNIVLRKDGLVVSNPNHTAPKTAYPERTPYLTKYKGKYYTNGLDDNGVVYGAMYGNKKGVRMDVLDIDALQKANALARKNVNPVPKNMLDLAKKLNIPSGYLENDAFVDDLRAMDKELTEATALFKSNGITITAQELLAPYVKQGDFSLRDFSARDLSVGVLERPGGTWFSFNMTAKEGKISRDFVMKPGRAPYVSHSLFMIDEEYQGFGVAKRLMKDSFKTYNEAGFKTVEVHAALDRGGYTWARFGFVPNEDSWSSLLDGLKYKHVENAPKEDPIKNKELKALLNSLDPEKPKGLWDIADSKYGKDILSGTNWEGAFSLKDKESVDRFNIYTNAHIKVMK